MPDRIQVVFNEGGVVELMLLENGIRSLKFDPAGSLFTADALGDPELKGALRRWMEASGTQGWMEGRELAAALKRIGFDIETLAAKYPG